MHKLQAILRLLLFIIFSTAGILTIALAAMADDLKNFYEMNAATELTVQDNQRISEIIKDHQALTENIDSDANMLTNLAPITIGKQPTDPNQPIGHITAKTLGQAKAILAGQLPPSTKTNQTPKWLERCNRKNNRIVLFVAGIGLILISFTCFTRHCLD